MIKKGTFKNSLFFLLGAFIYSFFYWITGHHIAHVFAMIILAVICYFLYKSESTKKELIKTNHVICMCAGAIFDSLSSGFPFGFI